MTKTYQLKPGQLSWDDFKYLINRPEIKVTLDAEKCADIVRSRAVVDHIIDTNQVVYGINTGLGLLANCRISAEKLHILQHNALLSHACGIGNPLSEKLTRMVLLLKINSLSMGYSGVRLELIERLLFFYNSQLLPKIPEKGSVGASGDLVPLAHLSLPLIGAGELLVDGKATPSDVALSQFNLEPLSLLPKEGLALVNGLQVSQALTLYALWQAERLFKTAILAGCLTIEASAASLAPLDDRIHQIKGHQAQISVAATYRDVLKGSLSHQRDAAREKAVQNPYSIRCQPQVMGAVRHQLTWIQQTLLVEMNSVSDNPLVFAQENEIISGGNFHGEMIAMMADNMAIAIAEIGALSERRIALLIDEQFSGLPAFLVKDQGLNSGFMMPQVTAAACASDNKALAHPHVVDSIPTSANQEDHVSMATSAALRLQPMLDNCATIIAVELLCAAQGVDFVGQEKLAPTTKKLHDMIRAEVPFYDVDRVHAPDIELVKQHILSGAYEPLVAIEPIP